MVFDKRVIKKLNLELDRPRVGLRVADNKNVAPIGDSRFVMFLILLVSYGAVAAVIVGAWRLVSGIGG